MDHNLCQTAIAFAKQKSKCSQPVRTIKAYNYMTQIAFPYKQNTFVVGGGAIMDVAVLSIIVMSSCLQSCVITLSYIHTSVLFFVKRSSSDHYVFPLVADSLPHIARPIALSLAKCQASTIGSIAGAETCRPTAAASYQLLRAPVAAVPHWWVKNPMTTMKPLSKKGLSSPMCIHPPVPSAWALVLAVPLAWTLLM